MKFVKRITALFLAMVMVMAMGITASAATVTVTDNGPSNHTYAAYKIFAGTQAEGSTELAVTGWGTDIDSTAFLSALQADATFKVNEKGETAETNLFAGCADAKSVAEKLANFGNDSAIAKAFAKVAYANITGDGTTLTTGDNTLDDGYYLIVDKSSLTGKDDAFNTALLQVTRTISITNKTDTPEFQKKVKDVNDSDSTVTANTDWNDSADYDIGDQVPFKLTATLPSNYADYTAYYLEFQDQMEKGLSFTESSVVVKVGSTTLTKGTDYTVTPVTTAIDATNGSIDTTNATGFKIVINNLKATTGKDAAVAGGTVTVYYTAELNQNAVLGSTGNVNEAKLIYSNNPNWTGDGDKGPHGETPWDHVIVFTYKVNVNKVQPDGAGTKALAGAAFKLEKKNQDGSWTTVKEYTVDEQNPATSFEFKGLDDGTYKLTETTTPAGFNTISPITFTITAEHTGEWTTAERKTILTNLSGADSNTGDGKITFTVAEDKSSLSTDVVNQKGSNLPSTGGMGTTVLYVAGIALIVVAGVVVIARKRNA